MNDKDKVRSVVARFFQIPEANVTDAYEFPRERLHGSVGRATFHAALKRMAGADLPTAMTATTFGALFSQETSRSEVKPVTAGVGGALPTVSIESSTTSDSGVGLDIEHVDHLPATADPWAEPFYQENFTAAEIAYCQRQPNPRESFCGLWCAKEAVMKCGQEFFCLKPLEIEIMHDGQGRPFVTITRGGQALAKRDCNLSISHSRGISVAMFVACGSGPTVTGANNKPAVELPPNSSSSPLARLALAMSGLSLLLWLLLVLKK